MVHNFLKYIRSYSALPNGDNPYNLGSILNLDKTPIPFEFLDGYTWEEKEAETVASKSLRSGWGMRQAMLILYIFADGSKPLKPKPMSHGSPDGNSLLEEQHMYDPPVMVEFNQKTYNNEACFVGWLEEEYLPYRAGLVAIICLS